MVSRYLTWKTYSKLDIFLFKQTKIDFSKWQMWHTAKSFVTYNHCWEVSWHDLRVSDVNIHLPHMGSITVHLVLVSNWPSFRLSVEKDASGRLVFFEYFIALDRRHRRVVVASPNVISCPENKIIFMLNTAKLALDPILQSYSENHYCKAIVRPNTAKLFLCN